MNGKKGRSGRPTELNDKLIKQVYDILKNVSYRSTACAILGINVSTFSGWYLRGKEQEEGIYHRFYVAVNKAEAWGEYVCSTAMIEASKDDWKAGKAWLTCRFPERWSPTREERKDQTVQKITLEFAGLPDSEESE